jgi:hypothetical protein
MVLRPAGKEFQQLTTCVTVWMIRFAWWTWIKLDSYYYDVFKVRVRKRSCVGLGV